MAVTFDIFQLSTFDSHLYIFCAVQIPFFHDVIKLPQLKNSVQFLFQRKNAGIFQQQFCVSPYLIPFQWTAGVYKRTLSLLLLSTYENKYSTQRIFFTISSNLIIERTASNFFSNDFILKSSSINSTSSLYSIFVDDFSSFLRENNIIFCSNV